MEKAPLLLGWSTRYGFARPPRLIVARAPLKLYRVWGSRISSAGKLVGTEWGTGFFSLEKPVSVLDAELKTKIAQYGNGVRFVSTFELKAGCEYWAGQVFHDHDDFRRPLTQIYIEGGEHALHSKLRLIRSREVLRHDAFVVFPSGKDTSEC